MLADLTLSLHAGRALEPEEIHASVDSLISEKVTPEMKADFLCALAAKGETADEIYGFAARLRLHSLAPSLPAGIPVMDLCGTGGDQLATFNISTTASLIVAAAGVPVAKHGNRAVTSRAGSADVLDCLGIQTGLEPEEAGLWIERFGFAFFLAPKYHPVFRFIAPARRLCSLRKQRTIFNILGPLLNPARPAFQLIGVPLPALCEPMALAGQRLGISRGMIVCGHVPERDAHLDEVSILGSTRTVSFQTEGPPAASALTIESLRLTRATLADLEGGDAVTNARIVEDILTGADRGPKRDAAVVNAAAALLTVGVAASWEEGLRRAGDVIDTGAARRKLDQLRNASKSNPDPPPERSQP